MTRQLFIVPEHEFEASHGLPEALPAGEEIRWQGAPHWQTLAIEAFHVRKLAIYFGVILALRGTFAIADGAGASEATISVLGLMPLAAVALALLGLIAWLTARTAVYTITNQRVVMRIGIVLSVTFNLPFKSLDAVGIKQFRNGTGDLPLTIGSRDSIAYLHLWPHARPWRFAKAEPMLRSISNVTEVANILTKAMAEATGGVALPVAFTTAAESPSCQAGNGNNGLATAS
jgi:Bacterial PH domain